MEINLAAIDLNLLVALDALLVESSVTRAARRVGLSQPAMSNALRRLRTLLDDPLLVRSGIGMTPTARALELVDPVHNVLDAIRLALAPRLQFDPLESPFTFRIACSDLTEATLIPPLLRRLSELAPRVNLRLFPLPGGLPAEELREGRMDLAVGSFRKPAPEFHLKHLYHESFVCLVRCGHPALDNHLTIERFAALGHVLVTPTGRPGGLVDDVLAQVGLTRRVLITTPNFLAAPVFVAESDLISTMPTSVARAVAAYLKVQLVEPPIDVPDFPVNLIWHSRTAADPPHEWLRQVLTEIAVELSSDA